MTALTDEQRWVFLGVIVLNFDPRVAVQKGHVLVGVLQLILQGLRSTGRGGGAGYFGVSASALFSSTSTSKIVSALVVKLSCTACDHLRA